MVFSSSYEGRRRRRRRRRRNRKRGGERGGKVPFVINLFATL
jgi:hypothetical protein